MLQKNTKMILDLDFIYINMVDFGVISCISSELSRIFVILIKIIAFYSDIINFA